MLKILLNLHCMLTVYNYLLTIKINKETNLITFTKCTGGSLIFWGCFFEDYFLDCEELKLS